MVIHNFPESFTLVPGDARRWKVRNVGSRPMALPLWEDETGLVCNGRTVSPRIHYIYIPSDHAPVSRQISCSDSFLCRSMTEAPEWHPCTSMGIMEFTEAGQWYETISLLPDAHDGMDCPLIWHRYLATDDANAEKLGDCGVLFNRLVSEGEVAGPEDYCEKLFIPRHVNGRKVDRVDLPRWRCSHYLREFVVEEGVPLVYMDFDIETLERIRIPHDTVLSEPPNGILNTAWFQRQEGDVYFCGYYCGTRGQPCDPVLRLKEGTIGILAGARGGQGRRKVILPDSLCYIGPNALTDVCGFRHHQAFDPVPRGTGPVGLSGKDITPENLYHLGRRGFAAKCLVPDGYEPIAPRLTYENGWIAHYYYADEYGSHIQYSLSLHLSTGRPENFEKLDNFAHARSMSWRQDRHTAHYFWTEDYLTHAAALIRKGVPASRELDALEERWHAIIPYRLSVNLNYLMQQTDTKNTGANFFGRKGGRRS